MFISTHIVTIDLMKWITPCTQIFGGCCLNVYLLEELLRGSGVYQPHKDLGTAVTFCQFALISVVSVVPLLDFQSPGSWRRIFLKERKLPLFSMFLMVAVFFSVSVINNSVWRYGISIPVHTMLRSSSTVISMIVGYICGRKKYTRSQVFGCIFMSLGIVMVILQTPISSGDPVMETAGDPVMETAGDPVVLYGRFLFGVYLLFAASILSALMGLYTENLFSRYGRHWQESIFYTHVLSLPLFGLYGASIREALGEVFVSRPQLSFSVGGNFHLNILRPLVVLVVNSLTQLICARGVNQMTTVASSLTVTVILSIRKFVSLLLSAYLFGNSFTIQGYVGSILVILGTVQYTLGLREREELSREKKSE